MYRYPLVIFLTLCSILSGAQETNKKRFEQGNVLITLAPLNIGNIFMPSLDFGASYFVTNRIEIQLKYGKKIDVYHYDDLYRFDGHKLLLEVPYYLNRNLYVSLEMGIHQNTFHDKMFYLQPNNDSVKIKDIYTVKDRRITVVPKMGHTFFITKHLIVDTYAGIGFQKLLRKVSELEYDETLGHKDPELYEWGVGPTYNNRNDFGAWLSFGVNINWKF
ncbi:MAG TPA: hypothetical protein VK179_11040 [Bacteroidales bacterium]|nr:hypothetical protein [Bacteroidales bacterium]